MNDLAFLDLIETLDDMGSFTPEKLQRSLQGALRTFQEVQMRINSSDPAIKAEGIKQAQEMRRALEIQAEKLCKTVGIDPAEMHKLVERETFSMGMKTVLESAKEELEQPAPKKVRKTKKIQIAG